MNEKRKLFISVAGVATLLLIVLNFSAFGAKTSGSSANQGVITIDSMKAFQTWIKNFVAEHPEHAQDIYNALNHMATVEIFGSSCMNPHLSPSSVTISEPLFIKIIQIINNVTIGDCGMVLCSTMGFDLYWKTGGGPSTGWILIGPFPSQTGQICQGAQVTSKGYLILFKGVPNGTYQLVFKTGGFGYYIEPTVQITINR